MNERRQYERKFYQMHKPHRPDNSELMHLLGEVMLMAVAVKDMNIVHELEKMKKTIDQTGANANITARLQSLKFKLQHRHHHHR